MATQNWSRNITFSSQRVASPATAGEVAQLITSNDRIGVVGAAHSFNDIADTDGVMLSLERLGRVIEIDAGQRTVRVEGGIRYHELCAQLNEAGWALHNLMSIPHFSVAGACATGTHGSGDANGGLATAVRAIELIDGRGRTRRFSRGDEVFGGAVINLGALGIVTELTLDIEPAFEMAQQLTLGVPTQTAIDDFDEIMASAYSVSLFTDWQGNSVNQLWRKHRLDTASSSGHADTWGGTPAGQNLTPNAEPGDGLVTPQMMAPGPWHERLPHISPTAEFPPGSELQSEYFVRRDHATAALRAIDDLSPALEPVIRMAEVRTVAGDDAWLSPFRGDTLALHFSWRINRWPAVRDVLPVLEAALAPFDPLPHWGKLYAMTPDVVQAGYPRFDDFVDLANEFDPDRRFRNRHLADLLGP